MTTLWNSGYVDSVISHSDSIEDPEQREDFLLEKKKLLKDDRVFNLQIRKARIEQLKTMDSIISPKRGRGIFDKMKDLLNIRLSKVGKLKNDVQFYALWLAIQIANDTPYGLTNYIQTQDKEKVKRVARKLRSGMVDVNGAGIAVDAPFGGFKHSGIGREAGEHGLEEFLEVKAVGGWS